MYRTSNQIRVVGATLAVVLGLGFVATAGGALSTDRVQTGPSIKLEPVIVKAPADRVVAGCDTQAM